MHFESFQRPFLNFIYLYRHHKHLYKQWLLLHIFIQRDSEGSLSTFANSFPGIQICKKGPFCQSKVHVHSRDVQLKHFKTILVMDSFPGASLNTSTRNLEKRRTFGLMHLKSCMESGYWTLF